MLRVTALVGAFAVAFTTGAWARGGPYDDEKTPMGWAFARIRNDEIADFGRRCGELDPRATNGWEDPCRRISPQFLIDVLTVPKWRDQVLRRHVRLRGVRIDGTVDLSDAEIMSEVWIHASRIEGGLILNYSHWGRPFSLEGSTLAGDLIANGMHTESFIALGNHAVFEGDVDLRSANVGTGLEMDKSSFAKGMFAISLSVGGSMLMRNIAAFGEIYLSHAKVDGNLEMTSSSFAKAIIADGLTIGGELLMGGRATFGGDVRLVGGKIGGDLDMETSSFAGVLNGNHFSVAGGLLMSGQAKFDGAIDLAGAKVDGPVEMSKSSFGSEVKLSGAKIGAYLEMNRSSFAKTVIAEELTVGAYLSMRDHGTFGGDVNLRGAKVSGNVEMINSSFASVMAEGLTVERNLVMSDHATFTGPVDLALAKVSGNVEMINSSFASVMAESLTVERNLVMRDHATFTGPVDLALAKVDGALDLRDTVATSVDLTGSVAGELLLAGLGWWCTGGKAPSGIAAAQSKAGVNTAPAHWSLGDPAWQNARCDGTDPATLPTLILRNVHVDEFQDSADAWPPSLDLEGFHYDRLGGFGGVGRDDMRKRLSAEWIDWLARDRTFSTQPYMQLSSVLAAAGYRGTADDIQVAERERERSEAWSQRNILYWGWLTILCYVVGYGIGLYTFSVSLWVVGFTGLGAGVLWFSPNARAPGYLWRLGASLHRLLPIVELSKEFRNFFDDPNNLGRGQCLYFAVHALVGWALGLFLLAAMAGLTQKG